MACRALLSCPSFLKSVGPNTMARFSMFIWLHWEKHCTLEHTDEHKLTEAAGGCREGSPVRAAHQYRWLMRACSVAWLTRGSLSNSALYLETF